MTDTPDPYDLIRTAREHVEENGPEPWEYMNGLDDEGWPVPVDLIPALADALEEALRYKTMWKTLEDHFEIVKNVQGSVVYDSVPIEQLNYAHAGLQAMHAIELQFLPATPDDPAEIDRRLKELRGTSDE